MDSSQRISNFFFEKRTNCVNDKKIYGTDKFPVQRSKTNKKAENFLIIQIKITQPRDITPTCSRHYPNNTMVSRILVSERENT